MDPNLPLEEFNPYRRLPTLRTLCSVAAGARMDWVIVVAVFGGAFFGYFVDHYATGFIAALASKLFSLVGR